jgi:NTE family protein
MKTSIAIACQGGGSQTAFTAGVLQGLFDAGIQDEFDIMSLSGASGGAVCAALVWYAIKRGERPVTKRLMAFWQDNTAQTPGERALNDLVVESVRMVNRGMMPILQLGPGSPFMKTMVDYATAGHRREFTDFKYLLHRYIDFDEIAAWAPQAVAPILVLGAASVLSGKLAKFNSARMPIKVEHILASCAVPNIFPAVEVDGDAYWDGLFSDNPPIDDLVRPAMVGPGNIPREIWLIKINPTGRESVPVRIDDIVDRRNQLEGNVSLFQNLKYIELINDMILLGAFKDAVLKRFGFTEPVRIPKVFNDEREKPYHIPCIEMSDAVQKTLDYEGKIDRSERNIRTLIAEGRTKAREFLAARAKRADAPV